MALRALREPNQGLPLDVSQAALNGGAWAGGSHCSQNVAKPIARDALNGDAQVQQVLHILLQLLRPLPIAQPVEQGGPHVVVPVENQAYLVGKEGSVKHKVDVL